MARNMQQKFNSDLSVFMQTIELGEGCIYQVGTYCHNLFIISVAVWCNETSSLDNFKRLQFQLGIKTFFFFFFRLHILVLTSSIYDIFESSYFFTDKFLFL